MSSFTGTDVVVIRSPKADHPEGHKPGCQHIGDGDRNSEALYTHFSATSLQSIASEYWFDFLSEDGMTEADALSRTSLASCITNMIPNQDGEWDDLLVAVTYHVAIDSYRDVAGDFASTAEIDLIESAANDCIVVTEQGVRSGRSIIINGEKWTTKNLEDLKMFRSIDPIDPID